MALGWRVTRSSQFVDLRSCAIRHYENNNVRAAIIRLPVGRTSIFYLIYSASQSRN